MILIHYVILLLKSSCCPDTPVFFRYISFPRFHLTCLISLSTMLTLPYYFSLTHSFEYLLIYSFENFLYCILVYRWQAVGFVHGVLNTDNMSIMGLTVDYGPYAFEEHFDPDFTPNGSDGGGRYTYARQPAMCKWNLQKLSQALSVHLPDNTETELLNTAWDKTYNEMYSKFMHQKFGLLTVQPGDKELIENYFTVLAETKTDFTDSFQALTEYAEDDKSDKDNLLENLISRGASPSEQEAMLRRKMKIHRLGMQPNQIQQIWDVIQNNPKQAVEMFGGAPIEAITAEIEGEKRNLDRQMKAYSDINKLQELSPTQLKSDNKNKWSEFLVKYYGRLSFEWKTPEDRIMSAKIMRENNPTFVLRNWILQDAIEAAEKGNYDEVSLPINLFFTYFYTLLRSLVSFS